MKPRLTKRILKYLLIVSMVIAVGIALIWVVLQGYSATWTGFGDFTKPNGEFVRGKTLWDWLQLFLVPLTLSIGVFFLNRSERAVERQIAENRAKLEREITLDRQQEAALQAYIDKVSDLLLKEKLLTTEIKEVRDVARTRTISIMRVLDMRRNNLVIQFLREADLINTPNSILTGARMEDMNLPKVNLFETNLQDVKLPKANLRDSYFSKANLQSAFLLEADLRNSNLEDANLQHAILISANLQGANLKHANLQHALLIGANLQEANLFKANLQEVILFKANLQDANLEGAEVTDEQLAKAVSLKGAIMPDGTKHE